ncbi:MAG: formyltransferase family protein [Candidatus Hodarchaeota archaeon]
MTGPYNPIGTKCLLRLLNEGLAPLYVIFLSNNLGPGRILSYFRKGLRKFFEKFLESFTNETRILTRKYINSLIKLEQYRSIREILVDYPIPVIKVRSVNDERFINFVSGLSIDLIITSSFREILRRQIIEIPSIGCINIHASLLPRYRGSDPIFWVLYNQEAQTGISIHEITPKIDAGRILVQNSLPINFSDDENTLREKLGRIAANELVNLLKNGRIKKLDPVQQKEDISSYHGEPTNKHRKELLKRKKKNNRWGLV